MPTRFRACAEPGCGMLVACGSRCSQHLCVRKTAAQRGYGARWQRESRAYLRMHPYCECPLHKGLSTAPRSNVVDHVIPHRGDMRLFWDRSNWMALAKSPCHDSWKQRQERRYLSA